MIASSCSIQSRLWAYLAGAFSLLFLLVLAAASPAAASSTSVGSPFLSSGMAMELAVQGTLFQQQTRRRTNTSRPPSTGSSRGASSSRGTSRGATSSTRSSTGRARTNTDSYRGSRNSYRGSRNGYRGSRGYYYGGYRGRSHFYYYPYSYPYYSSLYWWGPSMYYGYRAAEQYWDGGEAVGALDLDIKPERAEVWLDGEPIGIADNYDGFPRYLWLPEGDHRLVFYLDGYQTAVREFTIREGVVLQVKTQLGKGESKAALDFFPKSSERAEARQRGDEERLAPWRFKDRARDDDEEDEWEAGDQDDRDRWRTERSASGSERRADWRDRGDYRSEPARLILTVEPSDAVVYLDGRLLGSGEELARLHSGLLVDVGEHVLEITRPGFETEEVDFEAEAGKDVELDVELEKE